MADSCNVAFLADGKLYVRWEGREAELIESSFVQELLDRAERSRERNNWKSDGMAWNLHAGGFAPLGLATRPTEVRNFRFESVTRGRDTGELFYSILSDHVGGIFHLEFDGNYERRLVHRNGLHARDLALHPQERTLAMSLRFDDGTANIGVMEVDRRGIRELTEGDSIDESPAWVPGKARELVYQSAGVARNSQGYPDVLGPYSLHRLDVDQSKHETIVNNEKFDYLLPRMSGDGRLLYIRRPYQPYAPVSFVKSVEDAVLFPFRAVRTIVHVFHVISMVVSGKPMISAGGPNQRGPVPEQFWLWGRLVQANQRNRAGLIGSDDSLAPSDWKLIARAANGEEQTLADRVVAYDLCDDGSLVFTNGRRIWQLRPDGARQELCAGKLIHSLSAL